MSDSKVDLIIKLKKDLRKIFCQSVEEPQKACIDQKANRLRNAFSTFLLLFILSGVIFGLFLSHVKEARELWSIVRLSTEHRLLTKIKGRTFAELFEPYLLWLCLGATSGFVLIMASIMGMVGSFWKKCNFTIPAALILMNLLSLTTGFTLNEISSMKDGSRQRDMNNVLFEHFIIDEKFINDVENQLSCCGVISKDGFIRYPSQSSKACMPDEGFTSKPHPHCNYVLEELLMKTGMLDVAMGLIIMIFVSTTLFTCEWTRNYCVESKSSIKQNSASVKEDTLQGEGKLLIKC